MQPREPDLDPLLEYAWSGSAGVDAVVTPLVLIGHLACDAGIFRR